MQHFFIDKILNLDKTIFDLFSNKSADYNSLNILSKYFDKDFLYKFFKLITKLGEGYFELIIIIFLIILIYFNKNKLKIYRKYIFDIISLFFISSITVCILKRIFGRARPYVYSNPEIFKILDKNILFNSKFHSFPSGHTITVWATIWFLSFFIKNKFIKFCLFSTGTLVALSRIYLSYHWFSDVATSIVLSYFIAKYIYNKGRKKIIF